MNESETSYDFEIHVELFCTLLGHATHFDLVSNNVGTITTCTTFDNDGTINPTFEPSETYRYTRNEPRIINVEPRRFEIHTSYTTIDNDGTIRWNGVLPSAPSTDQIGQRNDLGLPIYFPDPITEQRIINVEEFPNEPIDDLPTFEQV